MAYSDSRSAGGCISQGHRGGLSGKHRYRLMEAQWAIQREWEELGVDLQRDEDVVGFLAMLPLSVPRPLNRVWTPLDHGP